MECQLIEQALKRDLPVLGICLGAQILAHTLGAPVRKHTRKEAGWHDIELTEEGRRDTLLGHFEPKEKVFQMHGDTFDIPTGAAQLAESELCPSQAFRYGDKAYGLQFHLEVDQAMIDRFLRVPQNRREVEEFAGAQAIAGLEADTQRYLARSLKLSTETFERFIKLFGGRERRTLIDPSHGKAR